MEKEETEMDELIKRVENLDKEAALESIERIKWADWVCGSADKEAREFRIGVMPIDVDKIRATAETYRLKLRRIFKNYHEYRISGFSI